jgi:hypothetical protein
VDAVDSSVFSDEEVAAVAARHPQLLRTGPGAVEGEIYVHAVYEGEEIQDSFRIRITKANPASSRLPALFEIGGRTNAIAVKWSVKDIKDLHRNPQGSACVCIKQEESERFPPGADLLYFTQRLACDYLYGLAFFDRHGRWPWGEWSHGALGLLEFHAGATDPPTPEAIGEILFALAAELNWKAYHRQLRRPSGNKICLCGSRRCFRTCHPIAWRGIVRLGKDMDILGIGRRGGFEQARARVRRRPLHPPLSQAKEACPQGERAALRPRARFPSPLKK